MTSIQGVRAALWAAYKKAEQTPDWIEGKSSEGYCELLYPNFWECDTPEQFAEPNGLMVYSYALGPSRQHWFFKAKEDRKPNYYTWESPDFYSKAVEVINQWADKIGNYDDQPSQVSDTTFQQILDKLDTTLSVRVAR